MRGYPKFNFDAFDAAALDLRTQGLTVFNPADMDRASGFDGSSYPDLTGFNVDDCIRHDVEAILKSDSVVVLPGWEKSIGVQSEISVARWAGREVFRYPELTPLQPKNEDILEEALRITKGDRQAQYGPPDQDFQRTAQMWSALKGVPFTAKEVALFMIALKLSRQTHQDKRDNWVDIAGYARCGSLCRLP